MDQISPFVPLQTIFREVSNPKQRVYQRCVPVECRGQRAGPPGVQFEEDEDSANGLKKTIFTPEPDSCKIDKRRTSHKQATYSRFSTNKKFSQELVTREAQASKIHWNDN